jgi:peptide/nickel transport system permease protein
MVIVAVFPPTLPTVAFAIGVVSWPNVARLTRAEFLRLKNQEFVTASRASGAFNRALIWSVILPNALPPLIIAATLNIATAILFEAGLSFLGLSDPNVMSWGLIIGNGREHIFTAWWIVTFPGIAIFLTSLAISLMGDGLNDALNPKLRQR